MIFKLCIGIVFFLAAFSGVSRAGAPQELRGKSVILTWTEHRLQRKSSVESFQPVQVATTMGVYVSTEGRLFSRRTASRKAYSGSVEGVRQPGVMSSAGGSRFQNQSLFLVSKMNVGARQIRVDFDPGFASCTLSILVAREGGAASIKGRSIITGDKLEYKHQGTSGESCAVRAGNIFE